MALAPLPTRLSSAKLELDRLNGEVNKFTVDTINHLKSLKLQLDAADAALQAQFDAIAPFSGLANATGAAINAGDAASIGASTLASRQDHQHRVFTGAPAQGIGAGNTEGSSTDLARADHDHTIRSTGDDLIVGSIIAGEAVRRVANTLVGQQFNILRLSASASTTSATASNVSADLSVALKASTNYLVVWFMVGSSAATTTGLRVGLNYSGTINATRYGIFGATGLAASQSEATTTIDTLLGQAGVGPGGTGRVNVLYALVSVTTAGTLAARFASGVAASQVTIGSNSLMLVIQQ